MRAQDAFARGALKVRGRPELLAGRAELFAALDRAFAPVRAPAPTLSTTTPGRLGAVQPFERLRAIARHGGDDRLLVAEAADCLGEFDDDPAALVVTCRRLLHHHPERTALWWLCARVLGGARAVGRARGTPRRSSATTTPPTASSALLPFPADHPVAVLGWPELTGRRARAASRPRGAGRAHATHGDDRWRSRLARSDASARPVDLVEASVAGAVAPAGRGRGRRAPTQVLVPEGTGDALADLSRPGLVVWLVAGVGRVLPARLFEAMLRGAG